MSKKKPGVIAETVRTVIFAVLIAFVIRVFAYEPFNIPSGSMKPTLLIGDYLFVSKFSYGYSRYSLPWGLPVIGDRILASQPERGDVVVFKLPKDNKTDYIKRVIGLPGDTVQVTDGILHINGEPVKRRRVGLASYAGSFRQATEYVETLPNGVEHRIWEDSDDKCWDNTPVYVVPEGHYFAMGDNRDHSADSRVFQDLSSGEWCPGKSYTEVTIATPVTWDVGFVPFENLVGRAEFLFFSHDQSASLIKPWTWPMAIRYGRLFDGIE